MTKNIVRLVLYSSVWVRNEQEIRPDNTKVTIFS